VSAATRSVCVNDTDGDGNCFACARNPESPCRMAARAAIHRLFESGRTSYRLDAYLDAFAHELAEKILALRAAVPDLKARELFKNGYDAALMVAAFEIDPEVSP
jgi:hypothetical protein